MPDAASVFAILLAWLGPAPKDSPKDFQVPAGQGIVALGDSITAGGGYLRDADAALAQHYADRKLPKIVNAGIGGQKAEDMVKRFAKDVVDRKPAVVTLNVGINDVWHRLKAPHDEAVLAKYKENVAKMVDLAQAANIKVILLAPTIIQENPQAEGNQRLTLYVEAMKQVAADKKCAFVDLHALFLDVLKKKPAEEKGNWLTSDGVHMKPLGDALMAIGVLRALGVPDEKIAATAIALPASRPAKPTTQPAGK